MTRLAALLIALASPAAAQDARVWAGTLHEPSSVTIHAPTTPAAVATVTFKNTRVHGEDETFALTYGDITVTVEFDWDADGSTAERITVHAPDGYAAVPRSIVVPEDETMALHIFRWIGG